MRTRNIIKKMWVRNISFVYCITKSLAYQIAVLTLLDYLAAHIVKDFLYDQKKKALPDPVPPLIQLGLF